MNELPPIPNDDNGAVLRRMLAGGDNLAEPRVINFCFIFPERRQALAFAAIVEDKDKEVCISYYEGRQMWQAQVNYFMFPTHAGITPLEAALTVKAASVGGKSDGWGCMRLPS